MIKVRGNKVNFTGKDKKWLFKISKELKMTPQQAFTGLMWESIMKNARERSLKYDTVRV